MNLWLVRRLAAASGAANTFKRHDLVAGPMFQPASQIIACDAGWNLNKGFAA
ncbi:MAG: hypothetical protein K1X79_11985 [Oligoflexia bacterium]|nr:hypothetical protein [Oligoflexia bacterium]